ncbi:MAG: hypothetical protein ACI856_001880 [Kiritimatiellia bacterium]|jgi:hypothetical protein
MRKDMWLANGVMFVMLAGSINADAQTNFIDEDFESPVYVSNTGNPSFPGWSWDGGAAVKSRTAAGSSDVPADDYPASTNQVIQFEWTSGEGNYDIAHGWSSNDMYVLTLNASPQSWGGASDRFLDPSLRQQDGAVLWSASELMPKYNNFGRKPWTPMQRFEFVILASNFTAGVEGQPLSLKIDHSGQRGIFVDDISLTEGPLPEDTTPPNPDPMTWEIEPTVMNFTNVTMTCTFAVDSPYGVQYFFENTNTGSNSGWQEGVLGNTWTESGLPPSTLCTYRAKARDRSPNSNETAWTTEVVLTTPPRDLTPPTPDPLTWEVEPQVVDDLNIYMKATTASDPYLGVEYYFENTNTGSNSGWQESSTWSETCQSTETPFIYRVKARDKSPDQNETTWASNVTVTIDATSPSGLLVSADFQTPLYNDNTVNPFFVGWALVGKSLRADLRGDGIPGLPSLTNQVVYFEQTSHSIVYDTCHAWSTDDIFALSLNASPSSWSGASDRYIEPSLLHQDNTVLWSTNVILPKYDPAFEDAAWTEAQTFAFEISALSFPTGLVADTVRLKIVQTGGRGIYIDNVSLTAGFLQPPSGVVLIVR